MKFFYNNKINKKILNNKNKNYCSNNNKQKILLSKYHSMLYP